MVPRRAASVYGSGRSSTAFTTLKIAEVAPMPSAIVRTAVIANAGWRRRLRNAKNTSRMTDSMESPSVR
jgi:hypothetical protein